MEKSRFPYGTPLLMLLAIGLFYARETCRIESTLLAMLLIEMPYIAALLLLPILCAGFFLSAIDYAAGLLRGYEQAELSMLLGYALGIALFIAYLLILGEGVVLIVTGSVLLIRLVWRRRG